MLLWTNMCAILNAFVAAIVFFTVANYIAYAYAFFIHPDRKIHKAINIEAVTI